MKKIDMNGGVLAGRFKLEALKIDDEGNEIAGTRRVVADWFENLVTDNGLDLFSSGSYLRYCQVGTGSTTPVNGNTALAAKVADTATILASSEGAQSSAPYFCWRRNTYRFSVGVAAGNLAEVGIGASSTANLFSRALILDNMGSPTTITVLSDEVLDVAYELRVYPPVDDWEGTVTLDGVVYDVTGRASEVDSSAYWFIGDVGDAGSLSYALAFDGAIGPITGAPSGASSFASSVVTGSYSSSSLLQDANMTWVLGDGNFAGGISAIRLRFGVGTYQFGFSPAIPKDNTKILALTVRNSWARKTL